MKAPSNIPWNRVLVYSALVAVCGVMSTHLVGCIEREGRPVAPCTNVAVADEIQVENVDSVDLLFMIDNSNSMTEEQANLAAELPRMIRILATGDFFEDGDNTDDPEDFEPVASLNVGVITSDMGTGGFIVPTCGRPDFGDDGIFRTQGATAMTGCMATYPSFLNFRTGAGVTPDTFSTDVACVAVVGTGGCGFEQQLESILKAITPVSATAWTADDFAPIDPPFFGMTSGHGDRANDLFARVDSVLAIIPVTDEEDCSAVDPELFNPDSTTYPTDLNLRCFAHRTALHPISRYVDGFLQLRQRPGLLIYAPIVGIPLNLQPGEDNYTALVGDETVRDPRMVERIDTTAANRLVPSCNEIGTGLAFPPIRIVEVAQALDTQGAGVTINSICNASFREALRGIVEQIRSALGEACLPRPLNLESDGSVDCDVIVRMPTGMGCDALPGSTDPGIMEGDRSVCIMEQLVPADRMDMAPLPTGNGWTYDTFSREGRDNCGNPADLTEGFQRIAFITQPPSGATVRLECFLTVEGTDPTMVSIGTFCDPTSDTLCPGGAAPGDPDVPLSCDIVTRACGVGCSTSADCRSSGLVGFVCDTRNLEDVDEEFAGNTTPYNFCVNPTCG